MKIVKNGNNKKTKYFICNNCGCEFEADKDEYKPTSQIGLIQGCKNYNIKCPCCNAYCETD